MINFSYYPNYRWNYYVPFRHCHGYQCIPYSYFVNTNVANVSQQLYNSGIMNDVIQQSIISQHQNNASELIMANG